LLSQISEELREDLNYFRLISDALATEENQTWGLSAVALGNSQNRRVFTDKFWWNTKVGLSTYLKEITGVTTTSPTVNVENTFADKSWWEKELGLSTYLKEVTGETTTSPTVNVENTEEDAQDKFLITQKETLSKTPQQITANWQRALDCFKDALKKSQESSEKVEYIYNALHEINKHDEALIHLLSSKTKLTEEHYDLDKVLDELKVDCDHEVELIEDLRNQKNDYLVLKPSLFKLIVFKIRKILNISLKNSLEEKYEEYISAIHKKNKTIQELKESIHTHSKTSRRRQIQLNTLDKEIDDKQMSLKKWDNIIAESNDICKDHLITPDFWKKSYEEQHLFSPNFTRKAQYVRDDLFVAAINLHKAFIDSVAEPLGSNLKNMMFILSGNYSGPHKDHLLQDLWASLFLVVPVISTTFASVENMLKGLESESLGWLLIDEAGQGNPQASVGAIHRAKRVISVGDPLQIEPVTTLPGALVESLATHHGVDPDQFMAPKASIQSLSDQANQYGTTIKRDFQDVRIGVPLLVHRRCENPMFNLSNELAYDNLMVYATTEKQSQISKVIGDSHWINIEGSGEDKWCPEEGDEVVKIIMKLTQELNCIPDIFIISPFKIVAQKMRYLLNSNKLFFKNYNVSIEEWTGDHIGTVHTFQGKEAEAVILLLGAPKIEQKGARNWATSQVNLLNVAVSRAKRAFYIVGNRELWGKSGYMELFRKNIPTP